jgi:hypothetical protein
LAGLIRLDEIELMIFFSWLRASHWVATGLSTHRANFGSPQKMIDANPCQKKTCEKSAFSTLAGHG